MSTQLILNSDQFFQTMVDEAFEERKIRVYPSLRSYVVDVLKHHLLIENLYDEEDPSGKKTRKTMAELYLTATQVGAKERVEKLKKLGDRSLYISGFFSDSFQRKIIDVDYYIDIGRLAYDSLSNDVTEDIFSRLFKDISLQFLDLMDVLALIAKKSRMTDDENILRLMDVYARTGSSLAGETLAEKGVFNRPQTKPTKQ